MSAAQKQYDKKRIFLLGVSLILIIFIVYEFKIILGIFTVRTIICELDDQPCPQVLTTAVTSLTGRSLFATDYAKILREQGMPLPVTLQKTQKKLPNELILSFNTQPLAYQLETTEGRYMVSETGIPFKETTSSVPVTIILKPPLQNILANPTEVAPSVHQPLRELAHAVTASSLRLSQLTWVDKDTITLIMNGEPQIVILDTHTTATALSRLERIVSSTEYQSVAGTVREIDLRFDLPVLRMQQ